MSYYALTLGGGGSGTVTSVSWTGGIVSIATATSTPAFTIAGTSGGIVYFDSATTWASSGVLTNNALIKGGGAGGAPSSVTTGTGVLTALGVNTGSAGAFVVNGGALGTPSSGTVTNLTGTASININGTVGATTPNTGTFSSTVHTGATSGTITITAPAVAGTQSYTLPSAVPASNGYALTATTAGVMSWSAITASAGGSTTQVQYNNAGALAGSANLVFDGANLGVGASLPTIYSVAKVIQLGAGTILEGRTGGASISTLSSNQYINTSSARTYITSDYASYYAQLNGQHQFYTAPSGTAGNTATFTQVLLLNKDQTVALQGASLSNGTGISFPATASASSDANTLDDYEEGTWTPQLTGSTGGPYTMSGSNGGKYTRVGRIVTVEAVLQWSGGGPFTGNLQVNGLPFANGGTTRSTGAFGYSNGTSIIPNSTYTWMTVSIDVNASAVLILQNGTSGNSGAPTVASSGVVFAFGLTYLAA
jgi:hypothetical protein